MKILVTANTFSPCSDGVANVVGAHTEGFLKAGHDVTVATQFHPERTPCLFPANLTVKQFKVRGNKNLRQGFTGDIDEYQRFIAESDADVAFFHCWETWSTDLVAPLLGRVRFKKVLVSHGVTANTRLFWPRKIPAWIAWQPYLHWGIPRLLPRFDRVVYLSNQVDNDRFIDRRIAKRLGIQNGMVIPNGVDLQAHEQAPSGFRQRHGIDGGLMFLCVGKYDEYKNEFAVADAVLRSGVAAATLVLIGPEINDYARRIRRHWDKLERPGLRLLSLAGLSSSDILSAYKEADMFIQASRTECFPLVILGAMASSTPFVSTEVGCVRQLPGGIVVPQIDELPRAIRTLADDKIRRRELAKAGRQACESEYSWPQVWSEYASLVDDLTRKQEGLCA
jgi:glycosyltransferase involved in cell wall biosynthesis